ncbi:MAG TPA: hypothetical protein VE010_20360 [Thermoanaerobaculia bacterium]|nr:hypothetical protein [Thermoanaerobaculia bacterium]
MVIGFLLLDERDDGILLAVAVTPVEPRAYVGYRIAASLLAACWDGAHACGAGCAVSGEDGASVGFVS